MGRKLRFYFSADRLPGGSVPVDSLLDGEASILFSSVVKTLGVTLDAALSFDQHVSVVLRSCFVPIRYLSKVRSYLTRKAAKKYCCLTNCAKAGLL